ncbi:MAG TPA: TetR/AcrR family transcriptional regulator [Acidimicrobiia bacterium]|jgi:AcrR family transcriptional regulator|nr:TetR/AcrR family transcriptional regulator [Acidimicrobiia bacterium]
MGEDELADGALGSRPALNRADILQTALRVRLEDDARTLSMRRLAAELDVTPMALYRHFDGKDDILLAMADALLAQLDLPPEDTPWQMYLHELALAMRALMRAEPFVVQLFARRPIRTPAAQWRLAGAMRVLGRAGFSEDDAASAYATVHIYNLGFCMLEQARSATGALNAPPDTTTPESARISGFVSERQFLAGLDAIIAGIGPAPAA